MNRNHSGSIESSSAMRRTSFAAAATRLDAALDGLQSASDNASLMKLNEAVAKIEREFADPEGLPARPWFRHVIFAPGFTAGYDSWPLPGIQQGLKDRDAALFESEMKKLIGP